MRVNSEIASREGGGRDGAMRNASRTRRGGVLSISTCIFQRAYGHVISMRIMAGRLS